MKLCMSMQPEFQRKAEHQRPGSVELLSVQSAQYLDPQQGRWSECQYRCRQQAIVQNIVWVIIAREL